MSQQRQTLPILLPWALLNAPVVHLEVLRLLHRRRLPTRIPTHQSRNNVQKIKRCVLKSRSFHLNTRTDFRFTTVSSPSNHPRSPNPQTTPRPDSNSVQPPQFPSKSSTIRINKQTNNEEPSTTGPESLLDTSSSSETSTAAPSRTHSRSDSWHQVSVPTFAPPLQQHQQQQPASNNATSKLSKLTLIIPKHGIAFTPPIDLIETATEFHLFVDVPGAHVGDVEVRMEEWGKVVVVRAGVEDPVEAFKDKLITNTNSIHERKVGEFMRRVKLSTAVDEKDCEASMLNGLLHVRMGKKGKSSG
ncbi:hypothetical protein BCR33DRAFT_57724 [Rhizoclosmatium globosum]|uniref:SHSP domain-containing protein n=1 Tax=Rhizoclosmatium globosum TaxID=329046 RepID=A0A1Y2CM29_9FUNG|nr:hypothetical protein BCR33DRAFT_57724 [Rhizoclosmatium globosum]|eukprot:ORY48053.1 hypothetical protein BCR33DRAFT_57724 [Rhizoclosmatium globosum]